MKTIKKLIFCIYLGIAALCLSSCKINTEVSSVDGDANLAIKTKIAIDETSLPVSIQEGSVNSLVAVLSEKREEDTFFNLKISANGVDATPLFNSISTNIQISADSISKAFVLEAIDDSVYKGTQDIKIELLPVNTEEVESGSEYILSLQDNDTPPQFTIDDGISVNEAGNVTLTVNLIPSDTVAAVASVNYSFLSGSATANVDFTAINGTLEFPVGTITKNINVPIISDAFVEGLETFSVNLSTPVNATILVGTAQASIVDDNGPTISIADVSYTEGTAGGPTIATLTITADSISGGDITVNYATVDDAATAADDDFASATGTVTITAGTLTNTFDININHDSIFEDNELFKVALSGGSNYTSAGSDLEADVTINNDDNEPTVQFDSATANISEGAATASIDISLSTISGTDTVVPFTISGTATGGGGTNDYTNPTSPITIPAGQLSLSQSFALYDDSNVEVDETIILTMGSPTGATASGNTVLTFTIQENDASPFTWIGSVDSDWSTPGNWFGGVAPGASDVAIFNSSCTGCNVTIDSASPLEGIEMDATYSGTITVGGGVALTIGASGYSQAGGTFIGNNENISTTSLALTGGVFTSTAGTLDISNSILISSATYNHNNGTVNISGTSSAADFGAAVLNNLSIDKTGNSTLSLTGNMTVDGDFSTAAASNFSISGTGNIDVKGDATLNSSLTSRSLGSTKLRLTGTTDQTLTSGGQRLGRLEILSTGGTVHFAGYIRLNNSFTYTSGVTDFGTSTIHQYGAAPWKVNPSIQFNNIYLDGDHSYTQIIGGMSVYGTFSVSIYSDGFGGTVEAYGDVIYPTNDNRGTVTLVGTNNQAVTATGSGGSPGFVINKTGGTVTFTGTIQPYNGINYIQGNYDVSSAYFKFVRSTIAPGSMQFNNVEISGGSSLSISGTLKVLGNLYFNRTGSVNTGTIDLQGHLSLVNANGGSAKFNLSGSNTQSVSYTTGTVPGSVFSINKSGGYAELSNQLGLLSAGQNLHLQSGTLRLNGFDLTVDNEIIIESGTIIHEGTAPVCGNLIYTTLTNNGGNVICPP